MFEHNRINFFHHKPKNKLVYFYNLMWEENILNSLSRHNHVYIIPTVSSDITTYKTIQLCNFFDEDEDDNF